MVVSHPVDVVEDHSHRAAVPDLILAAHLASGLLQALVEKTPLHMLA